LKLGGIERRDSADQRGELLRTTAEGSARASDQADVHLVGADIRDLRTARSLHREREAQPLDAIDRQ